MDIAIAHGLSWISLYKSVRPVGNLHRWLKRRLTVTEKVGSIDGVYWFDSACGAEVVLHINRDEELPIKRMRVIADNVSTDMEPYITLGMADLELVQSGMLPQLNRKAVGLKLTSEGWGDAHGLTLHIRFYKVDNDGVEMDYDKDPSYFLGVTTLDVNAGDILSSEVKEVIVLTLDDLKGLPKSGRAIGMEVTATDASGHEIHCGEGTSIIGFHIDEDGYFMPFGYGASVPVVAGVLIDAREPSFEC